jgi:polysaccharide transporter, PST family
MKTKFSSLSSNMLWLYGLQGVNYLGYLALLPFLVRVLGVEQYGLVAFAQSIAQYFIIGTDYGFNFSATRQITQQRDDPEAVSRIFWTVTIIKLTLVVLGLILLAILVALIPRLTEHPAIYFAAYGTVVGTAMFPGWLFQGLQEMRFISLITGTAKLAAVLSVVVLVRNPSDALLATLLQSSGFILAGAMGVFVALRFYIRRFTMPRREDIWNAIAEGRHLFISSASISLYTNTNTFLVGMIAGNAEVGYFSLADKFIRAITGLTVPAIQAAYPHTIALLKHSRAKALAFIRRSLLLALCCTVVPCALIAIFAGQIAAAAFGINGAVIAPMIQLLSIFPLICCVNAILSTQVLIPFGFDKWQSRLLLSIGIINVGFSSTLVAYWGAFGGVVSITVLEAVQFLLVAIFISRQDIGLFDSA